LCFAQSFSGMVKGGVNSSLVISSCSGIKTNMYYLWGTAPYFIAYCANSYGL